MSVDQTEKPAESQTPPHDNAMDVLRLLSDHRVAVTRTRFRYYDRLWVGHLEPILAAPDHSQPDKLGLFVTYDSADSSLSSAKMFRDIPSGPIQGEHRVSGSAEVWQELWPKLDPEAQLVISGFMAYVTHKGIAGIESCLDVPLADLQAPFSEPNDERRFRNLSSSPF